jgi:signal transduction histidine kinase/DNA-binding response OmpR family regulator
MTSIADKVLAGGGEMGALMRSLDWSGTPLGPVEKWPQSLRTMVSVMLGNRHPMAVWWGPEFLHLYNDAYRPILGEKHPSSLCAPGSRVWLESWQIIGPMARGVLETGAATWNEHFLFPVNRHGFLEETYFTFSYSPIPDDEGTLRGVLVTTRETTSEVQDARQLRTLRELAAQSAVAKSAEGALAGAARVLAQNNADLPFVLIYLVDGEPAAAKLACSSGMENHAGGAIDPGIWPLEEAAGMDVPLVVSDLAARVGAMPAGLWSQAPEKAVVLPLSRPGLARPYGFLVSGVNPHRLLDEGYLGFFRLVGEAIVAGISNARAYEEERKRAEALAELDRAKTLFFNNVSHELRTPLTLMLGPAEDMLAQGENALSPQNRENVSILQRNSLRMLKLVNTLLEFSRIEAGRTQAFFEPTDLAAGTADLASTFRSSIERAGLEFIVDCPPLPENVHVDRDMWEKIVFNLLSNAFKFTMEGRIVVRLENTGPDVRLTVSDTGSGIPPEELPRLFKRFHRVRGMQSRTHEGTGIGLALVRELVQLHGGTVEVESKVGEGTRFTVLIPKGRSHLPESQDVPERSLATSAIGARAYVEEARRWLHDEAFASDPIATEPESDGAGGTSVQGMGTSAQAAGSTEPRARILVVDDNADMRDYVGRLLKGRWDVETAEDGEKALASLRRQAPDLVLSDVMMPGMDGFALLREIRKDPSTRTVPVILLSARAGEESAHEGLEAGANDYLIKPFTARELLTRIGAHLEISRTRRQAEEGLRLAHAEAETQRVRLHTLFMEAPAPIAILRGPALVFEFANPPYRQVVGGRELIGKPIRQALPEVGEEILGILETVYREGRSFNAEEFAINLDRGHGPEATFFNLTYQAMHAPDGTIEGVLAFGYDVSNLVRARLKSEETGARLAGQKKVLEMMAKGSPLGDTLKALALLSEGLSDGALASILLVDPDGKRLVKGALPSLPDSWAGVTDQVPIGPNSGSCGAAAYARKPVMAEEIATDPRWTDYREAALSHGLQACWSVPILSSSGKVLGTFAMYYREPRAPGPEELRNIEILTHTAAIAIERKHAEDALGRMEAQLLHSQKMEAVGKLAGGIAHEFNNLLTAINGYTELMLATPPDEAVDRSFLLEVKRSGERAAELTSQLLAFGRKQMLAPRYLDLNEVLEGSRKMLRQVIGEHIDVRFKPAPGRLQAKADPGQIEQVILNLALNSRDAMPQGGTLALEASRITLEKGSELAPGAPPGDYVVLTVRDSGSGMDTATQARMFEPFFTTKGPGKGTGLGLAMVDGIVKQSGGYMRVKSEQGRGTEIGIFLPVESPPGKEKARSGPVPGPMENRGDETILVVEDESAVRSMVRQTLERKGYTVLEAASADEALKIHALHDGHPIQLMLTDVVMPGMDGRKLAELMKAARPMMSILFMSGYTEDSVIRRGNQENNLEFIGKPFGPEELATRVREVLARTESLSGTKG